MSTSNLSGTATTPNIQSDSGFGTNVGDAISQNPAARELVGRAGHPASRCNISRTEQRLRLISGTAFLTAAFAAPVNRWWRVAFAVFGTMDLVTGATRVCPFYQALGINTCRDE